MGYSHARWIPQYSTDGREDTGHRAGREMSQKQHNSRGKKALVFFSQTDECRCQQSRAVEQNSGIECDGGERVKGKKRH